MLRMTRSCGKRNLRQFSTAIRRTIQDEGDWFYSSEWWGSGSHGGHTVFRSTSDKGNGVVSVLAYPSSRPHEVHWPGTEKWLQQRYAETHPGCAHNGEFRILGYQWRTLRFNDDTRQSTVKIMAANTKSDPRTVHFMQQAHCLAVPYLKSMVSAGLATMASCNYDLENTILGSAVVDVVEIDPLVISASTQAMGFPRFSVMTPLGGRVHSKPNLIDEVFWKGIHERLFLHESDADKFILDSTRIYDMVFVDAYDGEDIFPRKLWDPESPFLHALEKRLHPEHGAVVVNLHSDSGILGGDGSAPSVHDGILPMGKYVSRVCRAYKDVLVGKSSGMAFTVSAPWVCNASLVVSRGFRRHNGIPDRDMVLNRLISKSLQLDSMLNLPFSCLQYIKRGFILVD
ncbi:hypothetical protein RJ640_010518 [Escallonia rubra]|uniref:Uncharacterized protein n=1 Tax=Escallonia rubra TaxID=112253 RepID=A0AA88QE89_9ASTE|nr:hypothetical protein RJ640_010518 [Escallonia rubra]